MQSSGNDLRALATTLGIALGLAGELTSGQYLGIVGWRTVRPLDNPFFAPLFATNRRTGGDEETRGRCNQLPSSQRRRAETMPCRVVWRAGRRTGLPPGKRRREA
jgi:hypothetical protein